MQLPPTDEIVMVAGTPPIRAKKARYYEDSRFKERILSPPALVKPAQGRADDWSGLPVPTRSEPTDAIAAPIPSDEDPTESERRHQPELNRTALQEKKAPIENEFEFDLPEEPDEEAAQNRRMTRLMQGVARQVSLDPNDGMEL